MNARCLKAFSLTKEEFIFFLILEKNIVQMSTSASFVAANGFEKNQSEHSAFPQNNNDA